MELDMQEESATRALCFMCLSFSSGVFVAEHSFAQNELSPLLSNVVWSRHKWVEGTLSRNLIENETSTDDA